MMRPAAAKKPKNAASRKKNQCPYSRRADSKGVNVKGKKEACAAAEGSCRHLDTVALELAQRTRLGRNGAGEKATGASKKKSRRVSRRGVFEGSMAEPDPEKGGGGGKLTCFT